VKPFGPEKLSTSEIKEALKSLGINKSQFMTSLSEAAESFSYYVSVAGGPNGQATWTAHKDAIALLRDRKVFDHLSAFAEKCGLKSQVADLLSCGHESRANLGSTTDLITGKLHVIQEWGGKARVIAIMDIWTQYFLTPLHKALEKVLKGLWMDGTFDQDAVSSRVRDWTANKSLELFSFDLTAATDSVPISLQEEILVQMTGDKLLAEEWKGVLTDRDFIDPTGIGRRYGTGQPMGAKTSFFMLALAHHVLIQVAAKRAGKTNYRDYVVVGDDSTITGAGVAAHYKTIMAAYHIPINLSKSIEHLAGGSTSAEICKRFFVDGVDLSGLPVKLIVKTVSDGRLATQLQNELHKRGMMLSPNHFWNFISGLINTQDLHKLILLNSVPTDVSGILTPMDPSISQAKPGSWYEGHVLTPTDLSNAHNYVSIVESLKRVDALLRSTAVIDEVIAEGGLGDDWEAISPLGESGLSNDEKAKLKAKFPVSNLSHPLIGAAQAEVSRITDLLARLRSGDPAMVAIAKKGLLDVFRNSLTELWHDDETARVTASHSLFEKTRRLLDKVILDTTDQTTSFTMMLTRVERLWTVKWKLGEGVLLNAVKARVQVSAAAAQAAFSKAASTLSFSLRGGSPD
jgi:hypothetical protein